MSDKGAARPLWARAIRGFWPLVILLWILLIAVAHFAAPSLEEVGNERAVSLSPDDAPALIAAKHIGNVFHESNSNSSVMIIVESDKPFQPGDAAHKYYDEVLKALREDKKHIQNIRDFWSDPLMADGAQSDDDKAAFVEVVLAGNQGEALANQSVQAVRQVLENVKHPPYVHGYLTGGAALAEDGNIAANAGATKIDLVTVAVLVTILLITYRSFSVLVLLFVMVGCTLAGAEGVVACLGHYQLLGLSPTATKMVTALTIAVGTDYAIFLIGRYQTARRAGEDRESAYYTMIRSVAHVILGSGLTVAGSIYCLSFARLPVFNAIAAPCAVSVLVAVMGSLLLGPAVIAGGSRFGAFEPKGTASTRGWRRVGTVVTRWPVPVLAGASVIALVGLLALVNYRPSYDDRSYIPQDTAANVGYHVADQHFSISRMSPETLMVETNHDMRNPADMLVLERIAKSIYHLPGIARTQGITRPGGTTPLAHTSLPYGLSIQDPVQVEGLDFQKERLADSKRMLDMLDVQIDNMELQYKIQQQMAEVSRITLEEDMPASLKSAKDAEEKVSVTEDYIRIARNLFHWIGSDCYDWSWCWAVRNSMDSMDSISSSVDQLETSIERLKKTYALTLEMLKITPKMIAQAKDQRKLQQAQYSTQLDQLRQKVLSLQNPGAMGKAFDTAHIDDSFYLGPDTFKNPDFQKALKTFLSPDGKAARFYITHDGDPMSPEGIAQIPVILSTAHDAIKGTPLEGSKLFITGAASMVKDMRDGATFDLMIAVISSLSLILVVMLILMRSLIASIVIVGTVAISLGASFGISVLIWQDILGIPLHWSVLVVAVIIMLAVGSDYNLLFVSRLREEMPAGIKTGIIRAMGATGSMETAAGLVFALTMGALVINDLLSLAQLGGSICLGILFDAFIVRAFMTPSIAAFLGRWFWWPLNVRSRPPRVKLSR
ncbi:MMPL domain protein [Segniliparus rotundus DSM 44985]|uniref:MMPL domain protein n=1 Tax=Segniliparus rotundus (strain ATCC BAA-972 / CDC 1076 / CIP 108378 / DSM 44985 / JCM 13578) TaxID=640132 RepID=D6ZBL2_SEGRD|nr:RND family transporter [Segniliparus rotundus]ADG98964.1 MMPL domain protein [Segniliparus rotundus DSM 44985]